MASTRIDEIQNPHFMLIADMDLDPDFHFTKLVVKQPFSKLFFLKC